ncbi:glutamate racemase [Myxococcota bacterium]|nr:glutamate racemase [Myxococcota bacterium]MBU1430394.1 glutamate racemase [Myxococcota bacterium]MBU1896568.1 glutamate racemase [Myxococcota bacterium]
MSPSPNAPIGIFDSGLGGLTVAAAIAARLPSERTLYLGDTARVPYGNRSPATVVRYARNNVAFLRERGVKLIVVACNTVSAQGLGGLADGGHLPIIGVIRPGARAALAASEGEIAVLGTPGTVRSGAYEQAIHEIDPQRVVRAYACPLFVPLVEAGWLNHPVTYKVAEEYLSPLIGTGVDTLILGCTHYPLLRGVIDEVATRLLGRRLRIIDSAEAVAAAVEGFLDEARLRATATPRRRFFVTDAPEGVEEIAARFWGDAVGEPLKLEHVDLVDKG